MHDHHHGTAYDGTPYPMMMAIVACAGVALASVVGVYRMPGVSLAGAANR